MKYLILFLFVLTPCLVQAGFSKPRLMGLLNRTNAWNAPDNTWCFTSEPGILKGKVHLGCFDEKGYFMGEWSDTGFRILARAGQDHMFSHPQPSFNKMTWSEYDEFSLKRSWESGTLVRSIEIVNLGPLSETSDSFFPYTSDSYFFKSKGEKPQLWIWKKNEVSPFFNPGAAYIFYPRIGPEGEIAVKTRDFHLSEEAPDRLWVYLDSWKMILEDTDANPASPWKSFRQHLIIEGKKVLTIATDDRGDALILIEEGLVKVLAREGKELSRFDHFSPKMRAGTIVVRGEDFEGRKATYVHDQDGFRKLITQGDIVHTPLAIGRVDYPNQDAIFYGAPGVDENGNVVLQATLTDADHPTTLLGIGIIKFLKE